MNDNKKSKAPKAVDTLMDIKDPMSMLLGLMLKEDAIVMEEKHGQERVTTLDVLPTKVNAFDFPDEAIWEMIEDVGGELHDTLEDDKLFRHVSLPFGWKKVSTKHPLWTHLVDNKGRKRAEIFYKAAFYDRSAHIRPCPRVYMVDLVREVLEYDVTSALKNSLTEDLAHYGRSFCDMIWPALYSVEEEGPKLIWMGEPCVRIWIRGDRDQTAEEHSLNEKNKAMAWFEENYTDPKDLTKCWNLPTMSVLEIPDVMARIKPLALEEKERFLQSRGENLCND